MILIAGFLFMVLLLALVGAFSGMLSFFVDIPSTLIILAPLVFFLAATKSGKVMAAYVRASFRKNYSYGKDELENISLAAKGMVKFTLGIGGFGFIAGLIGALANIGAPERLGPNLAVSLITLVYSIVLSFIVFFPVEVWAGNKAKHDFPGT